MTSNKHHKIIATIFFVLGTLNLMGWIAIGGWRIDEWLFLGYAILFVLAGWNIHNKTQVAKLLGVVASVISIPSFPIGTLIGVYGLWVLLMSERD